MANRVVPDRYGVINIGKLKENLVTEVHLPAPGFAGGSYAVLLRRPKEEQPYPVTVRHDGSSLVWTVQTADTAIAGMGKLECRWYGDNGEVAKSQIYTVRITDGLPDPTEAPEAWAGFMQQVSQDAGRAESAADNAAKTLQKLEDGIASGDFRGEKGEKGDKGDTGATGAQGEPGKDGADGKDGEDYVLTNEDKQEIAEMAAELVDVPDSGGNVDLTGYATEQWVKGQNFLTEVPDGYAKSSEIPKKPEDIGAQPAGNYALKTEIPSVPVQSVNGKTGAVNLTASDVKARPDSWMPTAQDVGALPSTYTPPNQTAEQVGADPKGTATSAVSQHNTADDSHGDIRLELKVINDRLTAFFDSDNQTLDELSEIVAYITSNKSLIDSITTSKVSVADIVNNLTSNVTNKPLSAAQGVVLKGLIDAVSNSLANYQPKGNYLTEETDPTVPAWAKQSTKPSYSKSEVGLGNVDNVKQYSESNPPPYPVTSVNGKTGAVSLTIPTVPTKVSAFTNDAGYLTEHQDISGKLDADKLPEAVTEIIESIEQQEANLFSFKNAQTNLARLSKNSASNGYIYDQGKKYGYKDYENEYFVLTPEGHAGIVGGLSLPLRSGNYKMQVELYIPTTVDATRTKVKFGVYVAPSIYANTSDFDLGEQGKWVKCEKVFTVSDGDTHVYPISSKSESPVFANTFYARNICITSLTPVQEGIEGKKWVAVGDSHTEKNSMATKRYYDYIAEQTGIVVTVNGVGGSGYKAKEDVSNSYYQRVLNLPSDTEVVTLFTSNNDLSTGAEIGTYTDTTTDTICGCINKTIDNLFSVLPTVKLGVITNVPPQSYNPMSTSENANEKLAEAVVALCKRRGIPCLDLFHSSGLRPWDENFRNLCYKHDPGQGHFDEDGHAFIAPRIKALLESIIM